MMSPPRIALAVEFNLEIMKSQNNVIAEGIEAFIFTSAISWIIAWFKREIDDFARSLKVFNFLIMLPPSAVAYLSSVLVLSPKGREFFKSGPDAIYTAKKALTDLLNPAVMFPQTLSLMASLPPTLILRSMVPDCLPSLKQDLPRDLTLRVLEANSTSSYFPTKTTKDAGDLNPAASLARTGHARYHRPSSYLSRFSKSLERHANYLNPPNYNKEDINKGTQGSLALGIAAASVFASMFYLPADLEWMEEK